MPGNCNMKVAHMRPQVLGMHNFFCLIFFWVMCWEQQHNFEFNRKNKVRHWLQLRRLNVTPYSNFKSTWKFELKCIVKVRHGQQGRIYVCKEKVFKTLNYRLIKSVFVFGNSWQANSGATEISVRFSSIYDVKVQFPLLPPETGCPLMSGNCKESRWALVPCPVSI